jgi:thiol-disulfide isomerase/thioredoxin
VIVHAILVALGTLAAAPTPDAAAPAPEFTHASEAEWLNSKPLRLARLRGRVVLVEFWTYDCVNCRRTLPWLKAMHERYAEDGLIIVSVHTPEFDHERDPSKVRAAVRRLGIDYPVMLDNDFSYWKALGNRYWPAFYLIGPTGRIERRAIGELHRGEARADRFEDAILELLVSAP